MGNYLQMAKRQQLMALLDLGCSFRRIEAETGVRRETISRYDAARRARAAKLFAGSAADTTDAPEGVATVVEAHAAEVFPGSPPNPALRNSVARRTCPWCQRTPRARPAPSGAAAGPSKPPTANTLQCGYRAQPVNARVVPKALPLPIGTQRPIQA